MQVIIPGHKDYLKFTTQAGIMENGYRLSDFIVRWETPDGMLLCNTLTGELVLLSNEEKVCLNAPMNDASQKLKGLIQHRFLIPVSTKETKSVEQIRSIMLKKIAAQKIITSYYILPTTYCNARCFYCYENQIPHTHMSEETAEQLTQFIVSHHGGKKVTLHWFGGEPTLGEKRINQISKILREQRIDYQANMTSNAYLFDEAMVARAKELWHLNRIQITLDGTEAIYNQTKAYVNASDNPFQRVLRNIRWLTEAGIQVFLRLNLDNHNLENLLELVDDLAADFKGCPYLYVYVTQLDEGVGFTPIHHSSEDYLRLYSYQICIQKKLEQNGWPLYAMTKLPCLQASFCIADYPGAILCTPDGLFGKCGTDIYGHTIGNLNDGIIDKNAFVYWQQREAYTGCDHCPFYPSCERLNKNCPAKMPKCNEYELQRRMENCQKLMRNEYERWKRGANQ